MRAGPVFAPVRRGSAGLRRGGGSLGLWGLTRQGVARRPKARRILARLGSRLALFLLLGCLVLPAFGNALPAALAQAENPPLQEAIAQEENPPSEGAATQAENPPLQEAIAQAENPPLQEAIAQQIAALDLGELTRMAQQQDLLPSDLPSLIAALAQGQPVLGQQELAAYVVGEITKTFQNSLWRMSRLLAPALLLGVLSHLRASLGREFVAKAAHYAGMLLVLGFLVADMQEHVQLSRGAITGMATTMQALFPLLVTLLAAVGGRASSAFFQPAVVAASGTMTTLLQNVTLPFAVGLGMLTMVGSLSENLRISRLCKLFQQVAHWTLGFAFTVFIGVMMVQGMGFAAVDGVSIRTAKYAIDNFIPIVGGMFSDTVDTLVGCSLLIQNAVGVLGLGVLLGVILGPMLQTVCTLLLYSATAAVLEPVADSPLSRCIGDFSRVYTLLFIIQLSVGAMFMLLVAQMLVVGNLTVMLR